MTDPPPWVNRRFLSSIRWLAPYSGLAVFIFKQLVTRCAVAQLKILSFPTSSLPHLLVQLFIHW